MTEFPYTTTVDVRYQDHDEMGHVNNATYVTYMEEARTKYLRDELGVPADELSMVVAHIEVDFVRSVQYADEVTVAVSVTDLGESSFTMAYELRDGEGSWPRARRCRSSSTRRRGRARRFPRRGASQSA